MRNQANLFRRNSYSTLTVVLQQGIEPCLDPYQGSVLAVITTGAKLALRPGFKPCSIFGLYPLESARSLRSSLLLAGSSFDGDQPISTYHSEYKLVRLGGNDPPASWMSTKRSTNELKAHIARTIKLHGQRQVGECASEPSG